MNQKRGQFFLLAAVIISSVLVNMGIIANQVTKNAEPKDFFEYHFMIKQESGDVIAYEMAHANNNLNLEDFSKRVATDLRDKDPEANFMFLYGNLTNLTIANYGSQRANACLGGSCTSIRNLETLGGSVRWGTSSYVVNTFPITGDRINVTSHSLTGTSPQELNVTIRGTVFRFNITDEKQLIFIMQKELNDESFIAAR